MIVIKLQGGLGNQMFQYAAAKRLALFNNTTLKLDTSFLLDRTPKEDFTFRKFELDTFYLKPRIASQYEIDKYLIRPNSTKRIDKIFNYINPHFNYIEKEFSFNPNVLELSKNTYLSGYFQSEKYFLEIEEQVREDFSFKENSDKSNKRLIDSILSSNSIGIHIRRGDFIENNKTNQFHGICSMDYYSKSIELMESQVNNPRFFVFSDDITWAKHNISLSSPTHFVDSNDSETGYKDLQLLSSCRHHIIANSSFSWWGAWLAKWEGQIVISPKKWFASELIDAKDIIPNQWIKI